MAATWEERVAALEVLNAEVSARLAMQLDAGNSRDTKAASLLGFILAALAFVFAQPHKLWLILPTAMAYVVAFYLFFDALRPRVYKAVPDPATAEKLYNDSLASGIQNVKETVLATSVATKRLAFEYNDKHVDAPKIRMWHHARIALIVAILFSVATLAVGSGSGTDRRSTGNHACGVVKHRGERFSRRSGLRAGARGGSTRADGAAPQPTGRELPGCSSGRG